MWIDFADLSALDPTVLLELPRLERDLSLRVHVHPAGRGLPGLYVRRHLQAPAAQHPEEDAGEAAHRLPESTSTGDDLLCAYVLKINPKYCHGLCNIVCTV